MATMYNHNKNVTNKDHHFFKKNPSSPKNKFTILLFTKENENITSLFKLYKKKQNNSTKCSLSLKTHRKDQLLEKCKSPKLNNSPSTHLHKRINYTIYLLHQYPLHPNFKKYLLLRFINHEWKP
jgi:hypothetical protein